MPRQGLSRHELDAIRGLAEICERHDGIKLKLNWSMLESRPAGETNDLLVYERGRLVGFCGIYAFLSTEAELSGMVHPDYRRRGVFTQLAAKAAQLCRERGMQRLIYICPRNSEAGQSFLQRQNLPYRDSEYAMELSNASAVPLSAASLPSGVTLRQGGKDDLNQLAELNRVGFGMSQEEATSLAAATLTPLEIPYLAERDGQAVGKLNVLFNDSAGLAFVFGFAVKPEERGRGIGRAMLSGVIERIRKERGLARFGLEVAATNERALGLYESCGFRTVSVIDYYTQQLN
ncbi:hypothetical protein SD70_18235 [Gordoniibacillus kamchatkensis]|uniref:N-acetyltransferase domain-containing protein n=2 Tax=Gordoniibacillus kamchatkensis TaxID=1590651 RepID=A0ABR5AFX6_9BACL|nr:hypothetical protein SD70_18235 [Paenibacillus sp. VKM B-2647]